MIRNKTVSTLKPMNWMGFRPQRSMKKNAAQYPGTSPATDRIRFPSETLRKVCQTTAPGAWLLLGDPKPIAERIVDELSPSP